MAITSKISKKITKPQLVTDDTLKDRSNTSPLFPEKIDKATRIMSLVRAKQENDMQ